MPGPQMPNASTPKPSEKPLPHAHLAIQKGWKTLSGDEPQRASQRPLPHVNGQIQKGWEELSGSKPERASQQPLPHANDAVGKGWKELSGDTPQLGSGSKPQRASQQPLPHDAVEKGWKELSGDAPQRASQRPLPHISDKIQKEWEDMFSSKIEEDTQTSTATPPIFSFDEESFRHFAPMLAASQDYARQSGFRFRSSSFDGLDSVAETLWMVGGTSPGMSNVAQALKQDAIAGSRMAAKITAAPSIRYFSDRIAAREPALVKELDQAFRIVVAESARNMMIETVKGLSLFPPLPAPEGIMHDDCSYEDVSAPLPIIAQRLYNDQLRRQRNEGLQGRQQSCAMTAAFLVDFAHHAGATMPVPPESYQSLLKEFTARRFEYAGRESAKQRAAAEFEAAEKAVKMKARTAVEKAAELEALWKSSDGTLPAPHMAHMAHAPEVPYAAPEGSCWKPHMAHTAAPEVTVKQDANQSGSMHGARGSFWSNRFGL